MESTYYMRRMKRVILKKWMDDDFAHFMWWYGGMEPIKKVY